MISPSFLSPVPSVPPAMFVPPPGLSMVSMGTNLPDRFPVIVNHPGLRVDGNRRRNMGVCRSTASGIGWLIIPATGLGQCISHQHSTQSDGNPLPSVPLLRSGPRTVCYEERYQDGYYDQDRADSLAHVSPPGARCELRLHDPRGQPTTQCVVLGGSRLLRHVAFGKPEDRLVRLGRL